MNRAVIFMGIAIFVLIIIVSMQLPRVRMAEAEVAEAKLLSQTTKSLLKMIGVRCTANTNDFLAVKQCIEPTLHKNDFEMDTFQLFKERTNTTGAYVILNDGQKTYSGKDFIMSKNGVEVARGCHILTDILPQYTCRFDLIEPCIPGDVFDISYDLDVDGETNNIRLMTKTC
ncbi:hypothetical protein GOV10_05605 [Candidatus Woesearchaeota archaeon]|nr:hypothetical protein [Candidatus Woesearchaeota archaeon]